MGDTVRIWVEVRHDFCVTHRAEAKALKARIRELEDEIRQRDLDD
jgi:hypothetical protein